MPPCQTGRAAQDFREVAQSRESTFPGPGKSSAGVAAGAARREQAGLLAPDRCGRPAFPGGCPSGRRHFGRQWAPCHPLQQRLCRGFAPRSLLTPFRAAGSHTIVIWPAPPRGARAHAHYSKKYRKKQADWPVGARPTAQKNSGSGGSVFRLWLPDPTAAGRIWRRPLADLGNCALGRARWWGSPLCGGCRHGILPVGHVWRTGTSAAAQGRRPVLRYRIWRKRI